MKRAYLLLLLAALSLPAFAQDKGIVFHKGSFEQALAKAKKENKLVFMDAYTVWCGPCKYLSKNVFTNDTVGRFFNENFICVKMDMEKGEGVELAEKYDVHSYPTLLYINSDGQAVHRTCGVSYTADAPQSLIRDGKDALDPEKSLAAVEKKYKSGNNDPALIFTYLKMRQSACLEYSEEVQKYLSSVPEKELISRNNWNILFLLHNDVESPQTQYMIANKEEFYKLYTKDSVDRKIYSAYNSSLREAVSNKDEETYNRLKEGFERTGHPGASKLIAEMDLSLYDKTQQHDKYAEAAKSYIEDYAQEDPNWLNSIAWHFYEVIDDRSLLEEAAKWSKRSIDMDDNYAFNDTYAALQYKLGNKEEALKYAKKAIDIAKNNDEDYSGTSDLLKKIEKMK